MSESRSLTDYPLALYSVRNVDPMCDGRRLLSPQKGRGSADAKSGASVFLRGLTTEKP